MTIWNEVSEAASSFVHGVEHVANAAADEMSREVNLAWDGAKIVVLQGELLAEGAATGLVLNPINAVEQLVNGVAGTHLPPIEFCNQEEVNNSIAGKVGMVAGSIALLVATDGAAAGVMGVEAGSIASLAVAGAVQGGLFTSSDSNKTGGALILDRIENAAIDAAAFATMGGIARGLGAYANPGAALGERMVQSAISNGAAGGASGLITAEGNAILKEGRLATADELINQVGAGVVFGAGFGAGTVALEAGVQALKGNLKAGDDVRARLNRGYENPDQVAARIDVKSEVSPQFVNEVGDTIDKLPQDVRRFMTDENIRVRVAKQVTDLDPAFKGMPVDGYGPGGTVDHAAGVYRRDLGAVVAEYHENTAGEVVKTDFTPGLTRHEIGHGIDDLLTKYSKNLRAASGDPKFVDAYNQDWTKIPTPLAIDDFWYYIQAPNLDVGAKEAFAEAFAATNGGSTFANQTEGFLNAFPKTAEVVREKINNLPAFKPPVRNYAK